MRWRDAQGRFCRPSLRAADPVQRLLPFRAAAAVDTPALIVSQTGADPPTLCLRCRGPGCFRCDFSGVTGECTIGATNSVLPNTYWEHTPQFEMLYQSSSYDGKEVEEGGDGRSMAIQGLKMRKLRIAPEPRADVAALKCAAADAAFTSRNTAPSSSVEKESKEESICRRHNLDPDTHANIKASLVVNDRDKEGSKVATTTPPLAVFNLPVVNGGVGRKRTRESNAPLRCCEVEATKYVCCTKLRRTCIDAARAAASGRIYRELTEATAPGRICIDAAAEAAASRAGAARWTNGEAVLQKRVAKAEVQLQAWWRESQREQMTLAAWKAGKCRQEGLPEAMNCRGQAIGYVEPEPIDYLDRIHIRVWPPQSDNPWYICILDATYSDTIASLKNKIWILSNGEEGLQKCGFAKDALNVFYKGRALSDLKTLEEESLVDDCILHICDPQRSPCMGVISTQLHQWRDLRTTKQGGKWPAPWIKSNNFM